VDPNGRDGMEGKQKTFDLFSDSQTTLTLALEDVANRCRPHFRPPISATLREETDKRQFRLTIVKVSGIPRRATRRINRVYFLWEAHSTDSVRQPRRIFSASFSPLMSLPHITVDITRNVPLFHVVWTNMTHAKVLYKKSEDLADTSS